jgi:hypothetical protein
MHGTRSGRLKRARALLITLALWLVASGADAHPWMIRYGYGTCGACHHDPSGAGALTHYGRSLYDVAMRTRDASESTDSPSSAFLFGAVPEPDWLELGGDVRLMGLASKVRGVPATKRLIWMQLDGHATLTKGGFVASGTLGYAPEGALGAALTRGTDHNLVSRQHWLGYAFQGETSFMLRVGRMNLPFGVRSIEHTLWARKLTRTNINDAQQYGAALYFDSKHLRGELMGIAGNFQLRPDRYRERGYSAYLEALLGDELAIGMSSLITHRDLDTVTLEETWRHAHGVTGRWAPAKPLVLLTEWDYMFESSRDNYYRRGLVSYLQADWEPIQGIHFMATGEANKVGVRGREWSYGGWLSYAWFCAPHTNLRLDGIYQSLGSPAGRAEALTVLLQAHVFL